MLSSTTNNQQIVNARILAEMAVQFNIGADILGKGNRHIESKLGAENMSGDTVMVPIVDGGTVYHELDLSGKDLSVKRDAVPVSVKPLTTAASVSQEDLTLSIKQPEIMGKRVANMALEASTMAVKSLAANAINAFVISKDDIINDNGFAGRNKIYDLFALCEGSKLAGETYGVVHPLVWSKLIAMFQGNYAPNDKQGGDLYRNELGELAGIKWSKTQLLKLIKARSVAGKTLGNLDFGNVFNQALYDVQAGMMVPSAPNGAFNLITDDENFGWSTAQTLFEVDNPKPGDLSLPFGIDGVNSTDVFGNDTGVPAQFRLVALDTDGDGVSDTAVFAAPFFFEGPRKNVTSDSYDETTHKLTGATTTNILTAGSTYLPPALVWKREDFLVAVKGLEKYFGCDSMTIPTTYKDKNILPLRGWAWTDAEKAKTIFRVDVLLGMAAYTRSSMNALYIEA